MIISLFNKAFKLMKKAPVKGCFVEFGVYKGGSFIQTIKMANKYLGEKVSFFGFDSFEGLPPTAIPLGEFLAENWKAGRFSDTSLQLVKQKLQRNGLRAKLIKGNFNKIKPLSHYGIKKIRFTHIDADLYEGYRDALWKITPYLQVGTVIIFDEYIAPSDYRYQDIRIHSRRAIDEWVKKTGFNLHLINFKWASGLFVIVDKEYLKRNGLYIELLRSDSIVGSLINLIEQVSRRFNI